MTQLEIPTAMIAEVHGALPMLQKIRIAAHAFVVSSPESLKQATEYVRLARETRAFYEGKRLTLAKPLAELTRATNDLFRDPIQSCDETMAVLRKKIGDYGLAERAANAAAMARSAETLAAGSIPTEIVPAPPEAKGLSIRETWDFRIVDATLVPHYLCSPDTAKIRTVIEGSGDKVGVIPGIEIFRKANVVVR